MPERPPSASRGDRGDRLPPGAGGNGFTSPPTGAAPATAAGGSWENYHQAITEVQDAGMYRQGPGKQAWKGRAKLIISVFIPSPFGKGKLLLNAIKKGRRWRAGKPFRPPTHCPMPGSNSFTGDTQVLMADGTWKAISQIRQGEYITATDPYTGQRTYERVTATIKSIGTKRLVQITTHANGETSTITATDEHPFWNHRTGTWTNAIDLKAGDQLGTGTTRIAVTAATTRTVTSSVQPHRHRTPHIRRRGAWSRGCLGPQREYLADGSGCPA